MCDQSNADVHEPRAKVRRNLGTDHELSSVPVRNCIHLDPIR